MPRGRVSRREQGGGCRATQGRSSRAGLASFGGGDGRARKWLGSRASLPATRGSCVAIGSQHDPR